MRPTFDERDAELRKQKLDAINRMKGPRVGDFVIFADGVQRRISYAIDWIEGEEPRFQTSDGGSWHLSLGYCTFSGSLYPGVPLSTLTDTGETKDGLVWFFHHDYPQAHSGVDTTIPFRVYRCSLPAKEV